MFFYKHNAGKEAEALARLEVIHPDVRRPHVNTLVSLINTPKGVAGELTIEQKVAKLRLKHICRNYDQFLLGHIISPSTPKLRKILLRRLLKLLHSSDMNKSLESVLRVEAYLARLVKSQPANTPVG